MAQEGHCQSDAECSEKIPWAVWFFSSGPRERAGSAFQARPVLEKAPFNALGYLRKGPGKARENFRIQEYVRPSGWEWRALQFLC